MKAFSRNQLSPGKVLLLASVVLFLSLGRTVAGTPARPANLNMLALGIAEVPQVPPAIPSCQKDAVDMVQWAYSQKGKLAADVFAITLLNEQATRSNFLKGVATLKTSAKPGDYSIVYLSSHGRGSASDFYFAAYDGSISWSAIQQALREVQGTVIVIIDACQCGGVRGDNLIVLSSSLKNEGSVGGPITVNSLFTRFLLEALNGAADFDKNGTVTLSEVETYVSNKLAQCDKEQTMTITRPGNIPSVLPLAGLMASASAVPAKQTPSILQQDLAGTTFSGSEDLGGYGKLTFKFLADGKVVMIDARVTVQGTYNLQAGQVAITLPGVAGYHGTLNGSTISGQGRDSRRTWNFSVSKQ